MRKILITVLFPAALLGLVFMIADGIVPLMPNSHSVSGRVLPGVPYVLAVLGIVFGLVYRQEQVVYGVLTLALGNIALDSLWPSLPVGGASWQVAYPLLALALPAYFLFVGLVPAPGVFGVRGALRLLIIVLVAQGVLMAADGVFPENMVAALDSLLHSRVFDRSFDSWTLLPQPSILFLSLATAVLLVQFVRRPEPVRAAFLGAMLAVGGALDGVGSGGVSSLYLAAAQAMLLVALAVDVYGMAYLDELTGLPGRRALLADFRRLGSKYTVAMVDVDHFKKFNDTHGHDVGDQVLQMVASKLAAVRGGGKSFRYGGEEFTVLFPGKDADHARPHLEALRQAIAAASFRLRGKDRPEMRPDTKPGKASGNNGKSVSVTVSIGLSEPGTDGKELPEEVMKEADKALYTAKKSGRNCVV